MATKMTREEAIKIVQSATVWTDEERDALAMLIPELAESEDERIREFLVKHVSEWIECIEHDIKLSSKDVESEEELAMFKAGLAYLEKQKDIDKMIVVSPEVWDNAITDAYENGKRDSEKQKENPKSADSISSNCVSDAKCENRWHKVGDSLPDNPREVLCKDEAGNYFIGRYYSGEGWEISNYDDEDKPHHLNPPVSKWIDFPSEKQKEQKPAEWSEEDEEILKLLILNIGRYMYFGGMSSERILSFLKSLRPQPKKGYSDEDEDRISDVLWCIEQSRKVAKNENDMGTCWSAERFVKSLRPQQRQEWSDEEKEILDSILSHYVLIDKPIDANGIPKEKYISLIKSIRFDTYKNCNSHWKPSEEQMKAMSYFVRKHQATANRATTKWPEFEAFKSLYNDLKKLM